MHPHTSFKSFRRIFLVAAVIACGAMATSTTIAAENMLGRQSQSDKERNGVSAQREMDGKPLEGHPEIHWNCSELMIEWGFSEATGKLAFDGSVELTYGPGALGVAKPLTEDKATSMTGERTWKSPASSGARRGITIPALYADAVLGPTRTIITVRTESGSFSFQPADLATGPILAPEYGFFIRSMKKPQASRAAQQTLKLRISTGGSRIRENSEGPAVVGTGETPPNSHEFGYAQLQRQQTWPPSAEMLTTKIGSNGLTGWGTKTDISVNANAGAEPLVLHGGALKVPARSVIVHPGPTPNHDVAIGWKSPFSGKVAITAKVAHVFRGGNGVEWSIRHDGKAGHRILAGGLIASGGAAETPSAADASKLAALDVEQGELVSLRIGDRGNYHCDSTAVELTLVELGDKARTWSLCKDVVDDIQAGNPHADSQGNAAVWCFFAPGRRAWWSRWSWEAPFKSEAATAREYMAELAKHHLKTVRQQTRELPEQTWEGAMESLHGKREWPAFPQVPYESPMKVDVPCKYLTGLWRIGAWQIVKNCPRVKRADLKKLPSIRTWAGEIREKLQAADANDPDGVYIVPDNPFIPLACETDRIILALDQMGRHDVAQDGITVWLENQQPDGALFISSYDDTRHSIGALTILCAAMEHYQLTGNREWLEREKPRLRKAVEWIIERRRKTMKETLTPEEAEQLRLGRNWSPYGLQLRMPCGDGEQGRYIYWNDAGGYRSVLMCGEAFRDIDADLGRRLLDEAGAYRKDLWKVVEKSIVESPVVRVTDGTYRSFVPQSFADRGPYTRELPAGTDLFGHCGHFNCDIVVPSAAIEHFLRSGILAIDDPRVDGHFEVLEDNFLSDNPWIRSKKHDYDPEQDWFAHAGWGYQSGWERMPDYYLLKDDIPSFLRSWLNHFATDINLGNWTFNEHTTFASNDKSHGNAVFLSNFRNLLVMEIGDALWLARATPRAWLEQGQKISVKNAPTYFGTVAYDIVSDVDHGKITATLEAPSRKAPTKLLLRFRHPKAAPMKSVSVNGKPWTDFNTDKETISLKGLSGAISVQANY